MAIENDITKVAASSVQKESEGFGNDFRRTMNERLSNPFVFSFILSWVCWNWLLIYDVFNFDETLSLNNKIEIISKYINKHHWDNLLLCPLISSAALAGIYIICSTFFIGIFNFYNVTLKANIRRLTRFGNIIPLETHLILEKNYEELEQEITKYRIENLKVQSQYRDALSNTEEYSTKLTKEIEENKRCKENYSIITARNTELTDKFNKLNIFSENKYTELRKLFPPNHIYKIEVINNNSTGSLNINKYFSEPIRVRIQENQIEGNQQLSPIQLLSLPIAFVLDVAKQKNIFEIYNLRVNDDGKVMMFQFKTTYESIIKITFYIFIQNNTNLFGYVNMDECFYQVKITQEPNH
jgi:hypothetical protein